VFESIRIEFSLCSNSNPRLFGELNYGAMLRHHSFHNRNILCTMEAAAYPSVAHGVPITPDSTTLTAQLGDLNVDPDAEDGKDNDETEADTPIPSNNSGGFDDPESDFEDYEGGGFTQECQF